MQNYLLLLTKSKQLPEGKHLHKGKQYEKKGRNRL